MVLTCVGSAVAGCGDSSSDYVAVGSSPNSGQVGVLETSSSTTTIVENASDGFQFQLQPLDGSLRALDADGGVRFALEATGSLEDAVLNLPLAADSGADGRSYVLSTGDSEVVLFDSGGQVAARIGNQEELLYPGGLAFHRPTGQLFVADTLNHRVVVYNGSGVFLRAFGEQGRAAGQLNGPTTVKIAIDGDSLWVVDAGSQRLQRFSLDGEPLQVVGGYGTEPGQFLGLSDLAVDPENGDLYASDSVTGCVTVLDARGDFDFRFRVIDDQGAYASILGVSVDEESIYLYLADDATAVDDPAFAGELVVS